MSEIFQLLGHNNYINSLAISPDGRYCYSAGADATIRFWDLWIGKQVHIIEHYASSIAISPDGSTLITDSTDKTVRLYSVESGKELIQLNGHLTPISKVLFSPDGLTALSGGFSTVFLWDIINHREIEHFTIYKESSLFLSMVFSADGSRAVFGGPNNSIYLWDLTELKEVRRYRGFRTASQRKARAEAFSDIMCLVFNVDESAVISGGMDGLIRVWDLQHHRERDRWSLHKRWINSIAISPDGYKGLSGGSDQTLVLFDINNGQELTRFTGHTNMISTVLFTPDGHQAISSSWDGSIRIWKLPR